MSSVPKSKEIYFHEMEIGQIGECWGDYIAFYDSPTWIRFTKDTDYSVSIFEVNDYPQNDGRLCIEANHKITVAVE